MPGDRGPMRSAAEDKDLLNDLKAFTYF